MIQHPKLGSLLPALFLACQAPQCLAAPDAERTVARSAALQVCSGSAATPATSPRRADRYPGAGLLEAVAREQGQVVRVHHMPWHRVDLALRQGACDVALLPARREADLAGLRQTRPVASFAIRAQVRANSGLRSWNDLDQAGVVVGIVKGSVPQAAIDSMFRHASIRLVEAPASVEAELHSGRSDALVFDAPWLVQARAAHPGSRVLEPTVPVHARAWVLVTADRDPGAAAQWDHWVRRSLSDGTLMPLDGRAP